MSILDMVRSKINEHSRRAISEGRATEAHFLALFMELLEMNFADVQGKANALLDKLAQLEADTKDLISKQGGTAAASGAPAGNLVTDDQLNSFAAVLDNIGTRIDALKDEVVHGLPSPTPPAEPTSPPAPATEPPTTPPPDSPPAEATS